MTTNSEGTAPAATSRSGQLTADQLLQYDEQGYVKNLVALTETEVIELQQMFEELAARLPKDIDINQVNMWHKCSPWLYRFCRHPMILGYVESVLGANFYQWGGQFFILHQLLLLAFLFLHFQTSHPQFYSVSSRHLPC